MSTGFSIRTAIFSIVLAIALWTLVSLRSSYEVPITVPIEFVCPPDRSIEAEVPAMVRMQIRASGWHLVNLLYFSADARCVVDLSTQKGMSFSIGPQELQQAFRSAVPATVLEVFSKDFGVQLGMVGEKKVPLRSLVSVQAAQGYILVNDVELQPDSVTLRANLKLLDSLHDWTTLRLLFNSCTESQSGTIHLSDSLHSIVQVEPSTVHYAFELQRSAEITLDDIPVRINGAASNSSHRVQPTSISLSVRAGVEHIEKLRAEDIVVSVDYATLSHDTTGVITPRIDVPKGVRVLSVHPATLVHLNEVSRQGAHPGLRPSGKRPLAALAK